MNESTEKDFKTLLENIRLMKGKKINSALLEDDSLGFVKLSFFKLFDFTEALVIEFDGEEKHIIENI